MKCLKAVFLTLTIFAFVNAQEGFRLVFPELPSGSFDISGMIEPARQGQWPATLVFASDEGEGCTSTIVGDGVLLTAAHCLDTVLEGQIFIGDDVLKVSCERHPSYEAFAQDQTTYPAYTADFALCSTVDAEGNQVSINTFTRDEINFERVSDRIALVNLGTEVTLLGYGCVVPSINTNFTSLFLGRVIVTELPKITSQGGVDLLTKTEGSAALCKGDSGGAAYMMVNGTRIIIGVNSLGDNVNSWIATTATHSFIDWARAWQEQRGLKICGLDVDASPCRKSP